jgi:hypothetical protein
MNGWYALNFFIALNPAILLGNWIYCKNKRSIIAIIIFHFVLNISSVLLQTEQFTKCIITVVLLVYRELLFGGIYAFLSKNNLNDWN